MRAVFIVVGVVMALMGALWTFQGLGVIGGGSMSGVDYWAKVGPVVAGLGVALVISAARHGR